MTQKTFEPVTLGPLQLANRLVVAPTTRNRTLANLPAGTVAEYYRQRATAGLIVTEGTSPMPDSSDSRIPALFNHDHVSWWGYVTAAVHWRHGNIFVQLAHQAAASSAADSRRVRDAFVRSAVLAVKAGFDGVEVHGTNGYVLEQSLNPAACDRATETHARFMLDVVGDVADAIGADRTGLRLPAWCVNGEIATHGEFPDAYTHLAAELQKMDVAYLHLIGHSKSAVGSRDALRTLRQVFTNTLIVNGGFQTLTDIEAAITSGGADLVSVGRSFIANPDFVERLQRRATETHNIISGLGSFHAGVGLEAG